MRWILALGFCLLLILPVFVTDTYIRHLFIMAFIYAVLASNWDLSLGYACLLYTSDAADEA